MRHLYRCPMRWADLDLLGHVNNVTYVDYLQEARVDLMRAVRPGGAGGDGGADLEDGVVVVRHEVTYLAPLQLRFRPVSIECWVTEVRAASFTLAYEVFHDDPEGSDVGPDGSPRLVYLRATTLLTPYVFADERPRRITSEERASLERFRDEPVGPSTGRIEPVGEREGAHRFPLHVRFSDVDVYRHVNNVKYFEYLQESRIRLVADTTRGHDLPPVSIVVAQTDVDYQRPILLRPEPYAVWSRVARFGTRSMTVVSEIADGSGGGDGAVFARARVVVVFFDPVGQRSTEPPSQMRELLAPAGH